jgi:hypothetical protein
LPLANDGAGLIAPSGSIIRVAFYIWGERELTDDWLWAAAICAVPFVAFGMVEAVAAMRRRRQVAIARRPKSRVQSGR